MALLVRLRSQRLSFSSQAISAGCVLRSVFVRLGKCYSSRLGEVLSAEQIQTEAQQLHLSVSSLKALPGLRRYLKIWRRARASESGKDEAERS